MTRDKKILEKYKKYTGKRTHKSGKNGKKQGKPMFKASRTKGRRRKKVNICMKIVIINVQKDNMSH